MSRSFGASHWLSKFLIGPSPKSFGSLIAQLLALPPNSLFLCLLIFIFMNLNSPQCRTVNVAHEKTRVGNTHATRPTDEAHFPH